MANFPGLWQGPAWDAVGPIVVTCQAGTVRAFDPVSGAQQFTLQAPADIGSLVTASNPLSGDLRYIGQASQGLGVIIGDGTRAKQMPDSLNCAMPNGASVAWDADAGVFRFLTCLSNLTYALFEVDADLDLIGTPTQVPNGLPGGTSQGVLQFYFVGGQAVIKWWDQASKEPVISPVTLAGVTVGQPPGSSTGPNGIYGVGPQGQPFCLPCNMSGVRPSLAVSPDETEWLASATLANNGGVETFVMPPFPAIPPRSSATVPVFPNFTKPMLIAPFLGEGVVGISNGALAEYGAFIDGDESDPKVAAALRDGTALCWCNDGKSDAVAPSWFRPGLDTFALENYLAWSRESIDDSFARFERNHRRLMAAGVGRIVWVTQGYTMSGDNGEPGRFPREIWSVQTIVDIQPRYVELANRLDGVVGISSFEHQRANGATGHPELFECERRMLAAAVMGRPRFAHPTAPGPQGHNYVPLVDGADAGLQSALLRRS